MQRFLFIFLLVISLKQSSFSQETFPIYRSLSVFGNVPFHFGHNHFSEDLNFGYGYGLNVRIPMHHFGITAQWQTSHHTFRDDALFHVNARQMRNRLYSLFFGYNLNSAHGTFEPRLNFSRLTSRYLSDYRNRQILAGLGLKYGLGVGEKGLFLSASLDYLTNMSSQIVAPDNFSKFMNQSQTVLFNLGLEWRFNK